MKLDVAKLAGWLCLVLLGCLVAAAFVALDVTAFSQGVAPGLMVLVVIVIAVSGTIAMLTL